MGMAPYGQPRYMDKITDHLVRVADDGSFWLDMEYFAYHYSDEQTYSSKFVDLFGRPRDPRMHFFTSGRGSRPISATSLPISTSNAASMSTTPTSRRASRRSPKRSS